MDLSIFNNNLFEAGTDFFNQLGIKLNSNTSTPLKAKELLKDLYKNKDIYKAVTETYFLGLVDDSVFGRNVPLLSKNKISLNEATGKINAEYNGLMVFAVKMNDSYLPARGEIAALTRAFNRVSKNIPVVLLLKYGKLLSLAASERTKYKQEWREGEKIGKISLLKDINIVLPHTGHLKILYDLKVAPDVTDFNALYTQWQEVFNVNLLNKKFYQELFYWYLWAVKEVKFPQMRPKEDVIPDEAHQSESVIRLLTRLLFCWFMKEKQELIPQFLFDKKEVKKILTKFSPEKKKSSVFYRAILQNLFFATLSVPIKNRKYIRESFQGKNKDYGNQYVYRYQSEFVDAKENLKLFKDIPFLNGGLFECLDEKPEQDNEKEIRLDGFSSKEKKQAFVPDYLFWDEHKGIDLSKELDKARKNNETVHGIIDILNSYKFTIEENTPLEEEIALDPELLGKVFESLLAYYNPETKANARKQTGSFYTPREIVNYMVDESLITAFQQKLSSAGIADNIEHSLRDLISYNETGNPFTEKETNAIIQVLENLKVLDPACGSGAFPMGILHKLVWILQKVDPENKKWFNSIIKRLPDYAQSEMRKKLEGENWDYLRKLGIIQQSVYGVDIQPIAIQIAKLRFFISLLVDQDIKGKAADNFGLMPLPNLDFKLVSANTLIGAPEQCQQNEGGLFFAQDEFFDKFNTLTGQYFGTYEPTEKKKLTKKIEKLVSNKVQEKVDQIQSLSTHTDKRFSKHVAEKNKAVIEQKKIDAKLWESYNNLFKHESVGFFDTKYFFPEVIEGFDIAIANPPYLKERDNKNVFESVNNSAFGKIYHQGKMDYWYYFLHKAIDVVKSNGVISYITSRYWLNSSGAKKLIQRVATELSFVNFIDIGKLKVFDAVAGQHMVAIYKKTKKIDEFIYKKLENDISDININSNTSNVDIKKLSNRNIFSENNEIILDSSYQDLSRTAPLSKIVDISQGVVEATDKVSNKQINTLKRLANINVGDGVFVLNKLELDRLKLNNIEKTIIKKYLDPNNLFRYGLNWSEKYLIYSDKETKEQIKKNKDFADLKKHFDKYKEFITSSNKPYGLHRARDLKYFTNPKIIFKGMFVENEFAYDEQDYFVGFSFSLIIQKDKQYSLKYILAILNSKFALDWFYKNGKKRGAGVDIGVEKLRLFPIKIANESTQKPFIQIVGEILVITKSSDYLNNSDKLVQVKEYEKQIDEMVYALYDLTYEEIKIIDPEFKMTEKEYKAFSLP